MKKQLVNALSSYRFNAEGASEQVAIEEGLSRRQSQTTLPLSIIRPNPNQPRTRFSQEKLEDLVLSIRERGILQPIRVREIKINAEYEIIAGERRFRAATELGLKEMPVVIVRDQTDQDAFIDALAENINREDLNPIDRANALVKLRENLGSHSWEEVGKMKAIGISRRQITNLLGLKSLPESIQDDIRTGVLTEKHGRALKTLSPQPELLTKAWKHIKAKKLSGDDTLAYVREVKRGTPRERTFKVTYRTDRDLIRTLEKKLRELRSTT